MPASKPEYRSRAMNAVFLSMPDGSETDISICTSCGAAARGRTNFDISEKCCTCWECGGPLTAEEKKHPGHYHAACDRLRRGKMDLARMENAALVENYNGPVFADGVRGGQDGYFRSLDELQDALADYDETAPCLEFAYCCTVSPIRINLDSVLEQITEEAYEDAYEDIKGVGELQESVDKFNATNAEIQTWNADYTRKVKV